MDKIIRPVPLPLNRSFYFLGIFFIGLNIAIAFFQSIVHFQFGAGIVFRQSFLPWFVLVATITLLEHFILLKYYHNRQYWTTFSALIIVIIASLVQLILFYNLLLGKEISSYYTTAYRVTLGTSTLYAISLVFSKAGKRLWLRTAGIFMFILNLFLISTFTWLMNSQVYHLRGRLEKIHQWTAMTGSLILALYVMNFLSELRKAEKVHTTQSGAMNAFMAFAAIIALAATLFLGLNLATNRNVGVLGRNKPVTESAQMVAQPFEARTYVNRQGDTLPYRLMKPLDYDPEKRYPLVVCLHHGGSHGTDNVRQVEGAWPAQLLSQPENRKKYPAFLLVPQCPAGSYWGGIPNYPAVDSLVFETIHALEEEFKIDVKRRYVTGLSGGGYGSWHFICTHPTMFAAAVPICGGGDPEFAQSIVAVAIWAFHGEKDGNVPVGFSRDMIGAIKKAGGHPRYTEFANADHNIWDQVNATPGLLDWLFAQKRQ